jgi:hypothetical protein
MTPTTHAPLLDGLAAVVLLGLCVACGAAAVVFVCALYVVPVLALVAGAAGILRWLGAW